MKITDVLTFKIC